MPPTPGAAKEGSVGKKRGISAAAGTVNPTCVFIGSDLNGPIGSDLDGQIREMGRRSQKWRSRCSAGAYTAGNGSA